MRRKDHGWLYIALLAFTIAITWLVVSAVSSARRSTIPPDIEKIMMPLDPNLDRTVFDNLAKRGQL